MNAIKEKIANRTAKICIVGLGYVGLPTAVFFAEKGYSVIGCDLQLSVVEKVNRGISPIKELNLDNRIAKLVKSGKLKATTEITGSVQASDIILIIVPTPTKEGFEPDLQYVISAGDSVSKGLKPNQLVILESTVYPGVTEDMLQPILEKSGLKAGVDFGLAYCPERYNPGDSEHTMEKVTRIVGGITDDCTEVSVELYRQVTAAKAVRDIKTAEMAKIIENTQRDLNIALMNEVALICEKLGLDVTDVIEAASTKWNFQPYRPGSVGGHCLPKDPWYLFKAAEKEQYLAEVVTAGRRINDRIPHHLVELLQEGMNSVKKTINGSTIVVLGLSYKENVGDTRNSPSIPLIWEIKSLGGTVVSYDPFVTAETAKERFDIRYHSSAVDHIFERADAIVLMTPHKEFLSLDFAKIKAEMNANPVIVDGRRLFPPESLEKYGFTYMGLGLGKARYYDPPKALPK
jgi:nucleotide sugar dehydrogenase